jgi:hypothetical protein
VGGTTLHVTIRDHTHFLGSVTLSTTCLPLFSPKSPNSVRRAPWHPLLKPTQSPAIIPPLSLLHAPSPTCARGRRSGVGSTDLPKSLLSSPRTNVGYSRRICAEAGLPSPPMTRHLIVRKPRANPAHVQAPGEMTPHRHFRPDHHNPLEPEQPEQPTPP